MAVRDGAMGRLEGFGNLGDGKLVVKQGSKGVIVVQGRRGVVMVVLGE